MIEKVFDYCLGNGKKIEKLIWDENIHLNHIIIPNGEGLPVHYSNSNVYLIINDGELSIKLGEQSINKYEKGKILTIPEDTKMELKNETCDRLEVFIIKAPAPQKPVKMV